MARTCMMRWTRAIKARMFRPAARRGRALQLFDEGARFLGDLGTTQDVPRWHEWWGSPAFYISA